MESYYDEELMTEGNCVFGQFILQQQHLLSLQKQAIFPEGKTILLVFYFPHRHKPLVLNLVSVGKQDKKSKVIGKISKRTLCTLYFCLVKSSFIQQHLIYLVYKITATEIKLIM